MAQFITSVTQRIEYIAAKNSVIYKMAELYYKDVVQKEVELASILQDDRVLCIGGGACPLSAILLHRLTGAKITVIDNDRACVLASRRAINRLGYADSIEILHGDGDAIDPCKFSVVHFAMQVCPLEQVFRAVENRLSSGARILVRRPRHRIKGLYSSMDSEPLRSCARITHKHLRNLGETILYQKEEPEYEEEMDMARHIDCFAASPLITA